MKALIETQDLSKSYLLGDSWLSVLKEINLTVLEGEILAIMGPSGCGKSTLLHLLGLLDTPSQGRIIFAGQDVGRLSADRRADFRNQKIGFVFQQFNLLSKISALENVLLPTLYAPQGHPLRMARGGLREKAKALLSGVGLADRLDHRPNQLSGGEQQRVAIARALVNGPELVLADEPTGNLDSQSGQEILTLLKELNQEGKTIIIVTHEANVASFCQRIIKMKDGEVV